MCIESREDYLRWARAELGVDLLGAPKTHYETNVLNVKNSLEDSELYVSLTNTIACCEEQYREDKGTDMVMSGELDVDIKPYRSVISKYYRKNCVWNERFPEPPEDGWVLPDNVFYKMNDLIRTTVVCKYADGPRYLFECLRDTLRDLGFEYKYYTRADDSGYYAHHLYIYFPVTVSDLEYNEVDVSIPFEIIMTTQLKEVLRGITHEFYKRERNDGEGSDDWKWSMKSKKFKSAYMNHAIHLLESVILELRDDVLS